MDKSTKLIELIKLIGNLSATGAFVINLGFIVFLYLITHAEDAELFPSPIVYLDAGANARGNLLYKPINGKMFCLGDEVLWEKNARFIRSTRIQRSYYLQVERPYNFSGPQAEKLTKTYGSELLTTRALYSTILPSTHVSEGFFDGGIQVFTLPTADELRPHEGIKPGDHLRLYVDVEAPFSQANGYYVPIVISEDCEPVPATAKGGQDAGPQLEMRAQR